MNAHQAGGFLSNVRMENYREPRHLMTGMAQRKMMKNIYQLPVALNTLRKKYPVQVASCQVTVIEYAVSLKHGHQAL